MKRLYGIVWKHGKSQYLLLAVLVLASLPFLYIAVELGKNIVDIIAGEFTPTNSYVGSTVANMNSGEMLVIFSTVFFLVVLINVFFREIIKALKGVSAEHVMRRMRHEMVRGNQSHGSLSDEFALSATHEIQELKDFFQSAIATPLQEGGQLITLMLFVFVQDVRLGFIALLVVPAQMLIIYAFQGSINKQSEKHILTIRTINDNINDHDSAEKVHGKIEEAYSIQRKIFMLKFWSKSGIHILAKAPVALFYLIGGLMALAGSITPGAVVAAVGAHISMQSHWNNLFVFYRVKESAGVRFKKVKELITA